MARGATDQVNLIQKEDDGRSHEPPRVDDALKQDQRLGHSVLAAHLQQDLVIFAERHTKDDGGDGFETVNPLFPF